MPCKDNLCYGTVKANTESKPQKWERTGKEEKITSKINVICSILVCYLILSLRVCSVTLNYDSTDLTGINGSVSQFAITKKCSHNWSYIFNLFTSSEYSSIQSFSLLIENVNIAS